MLERTAEKYLNNWYRKNHRKPLVLRGARQVGGRYRGRSKLTNLFIKRCIVPGESFLDFLGMNPK